MNKLNTYRYVNPPGEIFSVCAILVLLTVSLLKPNVGFAESTDPYTLKPFVAKYTAENDYVTGGKATLSLTKNENDSFDFILQTKPTGIFKWTGKGNITEHAVLPRLTKPFESIKYNYADKGNSDRSYQIDFDRNNANYTVTSGGKSETLALPDNTLDRLSVTLALLSEAQYNKGFSTVNVDALDNNTAQKVIFSNQGTENLVTPLGQFNALRIRKERQSSNRETIIWLAQLEKSIAFVPVKIEQYKRGKLTLRLRITSFTAVE